MKNNKEIYRFILTIFIIIICIIIYHIFTNSKKSLPSSPSHAATYQIGSSAQSIAALDSSGNISSLSFPTGMIMIWYPQDDALTSLNLLKMASTKNGIPAGWAVCDGSNGTPDLRGRFVLMAQDTVPAGAPAGSSVHSIMSKGGEETHSLTDDEMPFDRIAVGQNWEDGWPYSITNSLRYTGIPFFKFDLQRRPHNNMPPYYTLVYIMKL